MRLIDAEALVENIKIWCCKPCEAENRDYNRVRCRACEVGDALNWIYDAPEIEAAPVRNGQPVYHNRPARYEHYEMAHQTENGEPLYKRQYYKLQDNPIAYCSECGKRLCSRFSNYCPNCGADMREEENHDRHGADCTD